MENVKVEFKFSLGNKVSIKYDNSGYPTIYTIVQREYCEIVSSEIRIKYEIFSTLHDSCIVAEHMLVDAKDKNNGK